MVPFGCLAGTIASLVKPASRGAGAFQGRQHCQGERSMLTNRLIKLLKHPITTSIASAIVSTLLTLVFSTKPTIDRAVSKAIEDQSKEIFKVAGSTHGFIV